MMSFKRYLSVVNIISRKLHRRPQLKPYSVFFCLLQIVIQDPSLHCSCIQTVSDSDLVKKRRHLSYLDELQTYFFLVVFQPKTVNQRQNYIYKPHQPTYGAKM